MKIKILVLSILLFFSFEDIRDRGLNVTVLWLSGMAGAVYFLLSGEKRMTDILFAVCPGILLIVCSLLSKGRIGLGDGILFVVTGIYLKAGENARLLFLALLLAGMASLVLVSFCHHKKEDEIPFVPFVLLSYLCMIP